MENHTRNEPTELATAIGRAQQNLFRLQHPEGYWAGELFADSTLCSDYVLFMHWAGEVDPVLEEKCVAHIRRRQHTDGGWNIYENAPSDVSASVKAYFALKLAGQSPAAPWMQEARACILRLGGIPRMNTYAKLYLALLPGRQYCPGHHGTGGNRLLPALVYFSPVRTFVVEPGDAPSPGNSQSLQTDPATAR